MNTEKTLNDINTPIVYLGSEANNRLYIKREDLIPYSFGGNKARKGILFFNEIDKGNYDCVITYGSSHSNHCRVISNMATAKNMPCFIVSPQEVSDDTFNQKFMELFNATIITVPVSEVHDTINNTIDMLKEKGFKPYFIQGGGHGNIGTDAYVRCYNEIKQYELDNNTYFDYIFFASGTGTTHAGLVCGQIIHGDDRKIIGISIARKNPKGRNVVIDSVCEYIPNIKVKEAQDKVFFVDDYIGDGYGKDNYEINAIIKECMRKYGVPLDSTYTGKAYLGMMKYIKKKYINNSNILFIHTGGTPLFFDDFLKF